MAGKLTDELQSLVQRSGTNTGRMRTEAERAAFADNVRKDVAAIVYQLNTVYKELVQVLSSEQDLNALDYGLSGNVVYTHIRATAADAEAYWSDDQARARTVKETIDVLLAEIARLENEIQQAIDQDEYDDAGIRALIQGNSLDLLQLAHDTMGPNYTLDGDGLPNLSYSVTQALDAIGAFFSGYPGSGNTYTTTYPALSLTVNLSDINIDTTLDQAVITGLPTDLTAIRTFVGMDDASDSTPDYSAYGGSLNTVSDGDSLEEAIWKLDQTAGGTLQQSYDAGGAGTAGDIQLNSAKDKIRLKDDTASPINVVLEWVNALLSVVGQLRNTGLWLNADTWLGLEVSTVDPPANATAGRLNTRPGGSGKVELHYKNSSVPDANAQITRDGIVKELEVGHTALHAFSFSKFQAAVGPSKDTIEMADFVVQTLNFDSQQKETAYNVVPIPQDEQGGRPARVKFIGYFLLAPHTPPAYPGGTGVEFELQVSSGVGTPGTVGHKQQADAGWTSPVPRFDNSLGAGNEQDYIVLDWPVITLTNTQPGLLNIKLARNTPGANDSWDDDCGLVVLHAIWYR